MSWFKKIIPSIRTTVPKELPENVWTKCGGCSAVLYQAELDLNFNVCPKCDHHMRLRARQRLQIFLDEGEQIELGSEILPKDRLKFKDSKKYKDRLQFAQKQTDETDALIVLQGQLHRIPVVTAAFEFEFLGGSMGTVVGERFVRGVEHACRHQLPVICFAASGGARMQEGLFSLMQMARTSAVLAKLSKARLPFISILTDPTMGGVSASLATLGNVIIAEPKALIGFAGPRVIQQTVREVLPEGFQRAEFLLEHGAIDMIIDRRHMRLQVAKLLAKLLKLPPIVENETI